MARSRVERPPDCPAGPSANFTENTLAAGASSVTVAVGDESGQEATRSLPVVVLAPLAVAEISLPVATQGRAYAVQLVATGGDGAYTWSVTEGVLPDGLTLSTAGAISGTPTALGSATFTVQVTDEASATHSRAFTLVVAEIQDLASGVAVTGIGGGAESVRYYAIEVPAGATGLTVAISGGTGDADLYVRRALLPEQFAYDCRPLREGNQETCTFTSPTAGHWYIMLRGFTAYSGVELLATVQQ